MKKLEVTISPRGFENSSFVDHDGLECSIKQSSLATEQCIWLGVDKPKLTIFEPGNFGNYITQDMPDNFRTDSHMHLTRQQVALLLPLLQNFVESGQLELK